AAYNVKVQDPSPSVLPGDLFTVVTTRLSLAPGVASAAADCTMKQDMQLSVLGGHAHEHATHITISVTPAGGAAQVPYDVDWTPALIFDTPLKSFTRDAPLVFHSGDQIHVACTYQNDTGKTIAFPSEMCVGFGYYFPASAEIDCVDSYWPQ